MTDLTPWNRFGSADYGPSYRVADTRPNLIDALEESWAPPERWHIVPSFSDYIVSDKGRVRHRRANSPDLKGSLDKDGYRRVSLGGCTLRVHVIVAETFHGPRPEGLQCAHLDGNPKNNRADNLAWVTPKENNSHKAQQGRANGGHKEFWKFRRMLAPETVEQVRSSQLSSRKAAAAFGISQSYVVRLRNFFRRVGNGA